MTTYAAWTYPGKPVTGTRLDGGLALGHNGTNWPVCGVGIMGDTMAPWNQPAYALGCWTTSDIPGCLLLGSVAQQAALNSAALARVAEGQTPLWVAYSGPGLTTIEYHF